MLTTPIEEMWLQDRRAHSTGPAIYDGFPGSDVIELYRRYTEFYGPPSDIHLVSNPFSPLILIIVNLK